ncbi:hypothetical protein PBY51_003756 [Eleginops maclovinus]|uniref:Uncharacterized protein n=1 Tax=Eleginops maclovinus TaxID=56733 RepID=A0AAN7Y221_ELEMC|nr:hypothetical protein PBY51_003756 [Eleginops maclovinus]
MNHTYIDKGILRCRPPPAGPIPWDCYKALHNEHQLWKRVAAAATEHPLSAGGEFGAVGSPFIGAPPRNQSIKFSITLATL